MVNVLIPFVLGAAAVTIVVVAIAAASSKQCRYCGNYAGYGADYCPECGRRF